MCLTAVSLNESKRNVGNTDLTLWFLSSRLCLCQRRGLAILWPGLDFGPKINSSLQFPASRIQDSVMYSVRSPPAGVHCSAGPFLRIRILSPSGCGASRNVFPQKPTTQALLVAALPTTLSLRPGLPHPVHTLHRGISQLSHSRDSRYSAKR